MRLVNHGEFLLVIYLVGGYNPYLPEQIFWELLG